MKYPRTAAGYAEYLKSEHWDRLRSAVLARDGGRCVRCHGLGWQVHHRFYRVDWETAQPSDCETLCRRCHEKQHPDKVQKPTPRPVPKTRPTPSFVSFADVLASRARGDISRAEFNHWKSVFSMDKSGIPGHRWSKLAKKRMPKKLRKRVVLGHKTLGCKPWFYSPPKPRWVNRGSSTN